MFMGHIRTREMTRDSPIQPHAAGDSNEPVEGIHGIEIDPGVDPAIGYFASLEVNLQKLRSLRLEEPPQRIYITPMAKNNLQARDDALFPLSEKVEEFLTSERQVMLILGDSGIDKSTFSRHLGRQLWTGYKPGYAIPLYINLPFVDNPVHELVEKMLHYHNFLNDQILEMKQHHRFILICDGYDESQTKVNIHTTNQFNQPGQWKVKVVISCRTQYLEQNYRSWFQPQPVDRYQGALPDLFQEAVLAPFSNAQIEDYVSRYIPLEPRSWVTEDYMQILATVPNLMDLFNSTTLLLHWFGVNKRRLEGNTLSVDDRTVFDQLLDAGFISMGLDYSTRLAKAIFEKQNGNAVVQYTDLADLKTWKAEFFGKEPEVQLLQESSRLTRSSSRLPSADDSDGAQGGSGSAGFQESDTSGLLFSQDITTEPSVIQFLSERISPDPGFEQQLRNIIAQTKTDAVAIIGATNAITILVKAGVPFHGVDLQDIKVPGADLSDGQFDSADFRGADLTGVNLARSWLRHVDMSTALLEGVRFGELPYLKGESYIRDCTYSPDGRMLAMALEHAVVEIYDTASWTRIHQLKGHQSRVYCLAFSPNGQQLVSGCNGNDKTVRLWDTISGDTLFVMDGHIDDVKSVAFSPSAAQIASASYDTTVRLWDSQTGRDIFILRGHNGPVMSITYSTDGLLLVSGSMDETIRFWDPRTGEPGFVWSPSFGGVRSLAYSPDGHTLASGHSDGGLRLWHAGSGEQGPVLHGHSDEVTGVAFSPTGQWIASSSDDGTVRLWDGSAGIQVSILTGHDDQVCCVAFSPDGSQIASATYFKVRLWEVSSSLLSAKSQSRPSPAWKVTYSSDCRTVLSVDGHGTVQKLDVKSGASESFPLQRLDLQLITARAFSPDGKQLATGVEDFSILLWDIPSGALGPILRGLTNGVCSLAYSSSGRHLASASSDGSVRLWDLRDTEQSFLVAEFEGRVDAVAFSPSGHDLVFDSFSGTTVNVFDLESRTLASFKGLTGQWNTVFAYSPHGQQLAIGTFDKSIHLWDLQSKTPNVVLNAHYGPVYCIAYSLCARWIASSGSGDTVQLWHRQPGEKETWSFITSVRGFFADVLDIVWNTVVSMEFVTGCADGSIRAWRISSDGDDEGPVVKLLWGPNLSILCADGLVLKDATDLSPTNRTLLVQRGAIGDILASGEGMY
ncbi:hypothetical protein BGZ88_001044 [Linnemannia elongata]|nr:hypothetical protein BGZ88_001044 [Linnemannia elongata]